MPERPTVLHYVGYDDDRGGIVSVVRALAETGRFECILGVNTGCRQSRKPKLPLLELPAIKGEKIGLVNAWRARAVAKTVREWLCGDETRIFHGHSRAGLLVALWLRSWGERRVVVSVHCFGKQRWFYRWASGRLGERLYWLTPAMRTYYGAAGEGWAQCIPGAVAAGESTRGSAPKPASSQVRLLGVGALVRWKGWHHVLDALAELPSEVSSRVSFVHIGKDDGTSDSVRYATDLGEQSERAALKGRVKLLGQQPSSTRFLAECDALVVASENEPFSVAMLEALQAGVPVIAADSGGATDLIVPPVNGLLFKTGSSYDLACVLRLLVEGGALERVSVDREGLRRFTAPVVAAQWAEVYQRLSVAD